MNFILKKLAGNKKSLAILSVFFLFATPAFADQVFSWQQCVDLAIHNNNNLKNALYTQKSSEYQKNAAFSGFLPQATATLSSNRGTAGNSTNPSLSTTQSNISQTYSGALTVNQNLFSGFLDTGEFNQAKANYLVSQTNVAIVKAQVSYDLKSAYQNLFYAKETVNLQDNIIHRREDNLRIIALRFKSGMENKGSLLLAQAYLEQAKYDRLQGINLIDSARAQLCKAIGMSDCEAYDINDQIPTTTPEKTINFKTITLSTPQHLQAVAQQKAAQAGITIAKSSFLPSVNLSLAKGRRDEGFFPQNGYWSFGMNLSLPFFSGGKDYYTTLGAYSTNLAAKENLETTDQQVLVNLKQSYNSYIEAIAKLKVDESFKSASELRADIARNQYNNGLSTFQDWDLVETDLINRQKSYLQSKRDLVINEAAWQQAQGKGVFDNE
jgi:outer membrane protein TolC